jgi:hypothetical protein
MGAEQDSIGSVFAKLADDAGALVRAEVELYRAAALHRLALSRRAFIFIGIAVLLALAAVISLVVMLAIGLSAWIGPVGAGLVVALCVLALAALLARYGANLLDEATDEAKKDNPL